MRSVFGIQYSVFWTPLTVVARELLPVLLVLYPLLLLLDDLEPGFVRSVVNPHWFLVALIVVGIVAGRGASSPSRTPSTAVEGEKLRAVLAIAVAVAVGFWVWWRLQAGMLGIVVALLAAIAVGAVVLAARTTEPSDNP
ncbi:MAG: hypothetical protein Q7S96_00705 [bacterium]|nr:hypothetical protein [bacterium]